MKKKQFEMNTDNLRDEQLEEVTARVNTRGFSKASFNQKLFGYKLQMNSVNREGERSLNCYS